MADEVRVLTQQEQDNKQQDKLTCYLHNHSPPYSVLSVIDLDSFTKPFSTGR